jgi:NADPH-dependent curcumin reductase
MDSYSRIVLATRPQDLPGPEHFRIERVSPAPVEPGQVRVQIHYAALSPWQGQRLKDFRNYTRPFEIGELIDCDTLGEVVETSTDTVPVGSWVTGRLGWQEYANVSADRLDLIPITAGFDKTLWLTALSSPGLTAYAAFDMFGRPMPGQTLVVTSAAGSVGSYAVQLGKLAGARVVGIAGDPHKCAHVTATLGADACVSHRSAHFAEELSEATNGNVHLFFDTVGGPIGDTVFNNLAQYARVLFVGRTASNNSATPHLDPINLRQLWAREASMMCFSRYSYDERWAFARERMVDLCQAGKIVASDNIVQGFTSTPQALGDMLAGKFVGKVLVQFT